MPRRLRYVVVDVFTDTPLQGNQLAVFTDARDLDTETMQALAREMAFSETVFVLPPGVGPHPATQPQRRDETASQGASHRENNDETVFVLPAEAPDADVRIRIFTPVAELPSAGHPVLG